ncbi:MAG: hypothetical protein ACTJHT_03445 [Sphingobacterium sp.]|uniref:hypothetical protein n=1 Tax=Sphingobacterium sp. JB170 TaxID=1434842 RepID=UPI00117B4CC4|nr:hypothetical protein [Sphingobacterium sp. JB170]
MKSVARACHPSKRTSREGLGKSVFFTRTMNHIFGATKNDGHGIMYLFCFNAVIGWVVIDSTPEKKNKSTHHRVNYYR